jgi:hypothetical protein
LTLAINPAFCIFLVTALAKEEVCAEKRKLSDAMLAAAYVVLTLRHKNERSSTTVLLSACYEQRSGCERSARNGISPVRRTRSTFKSMGVRHGLAYVPHTALSTAFLIQLPYVQEMAHWGDCPMNRKGVISKNS